MGMHLIASPLYDFSFIIPLILLLHTTRENMDKKVLFIDSVMGIRNPKAHGLIKQEDPFKTLEYLSLASLLAKKVDEAKFNSDA
jgi:hypothetical protein